MQRSKIKELYSWISNLSVLNWVVKPSWKPPILVLAEVSFLPRFPSLKLRLENKSSLFTPPLLRVILAEKAAANQRPSSCTLMNNIVLENMRTGIWESSGCTSFPFWVEFLQELPTSPYFLPTFVLDDFRLNISFRFRIVLKLRFGKQYCEILAISCICLRIDRSPSFLNVSG